MRRGFKAWCERTATEYRQAFGVVPTGALDPRRLAARLGVRAAVPEDIPTLSDAARRQLVEVDPSSWSAVSIARGNDRLVILNSGNSEARQRSSLAHELSHLILNHATDEARLTHEGLLFRGTFDREQEEEADWLGGCLLVPRAGLLKARLRTPDVHALATMFGVSTELISWRLQKTGVLRQVRQRPTPRRTERHQAARRSGSAATGVS